MTTHTTRSFELDAPVCEVWAFLSNPANRASALSMVDDFVRDGDATTWQVRLPIIGETFSVETRDIARDPPHFVRFEADSALLHVVGEHRLEERGEGCLIRNEFTVDSPVPGVESFFERQLDQEIENLRAALAASLDESLPETPETD